MGRRVPSFDGVGILPPVGPGPSPPLPVVKASSTPLASLFPFLFCLIPKVVSFPPSKLFFRIFRAPTNSIFLFFTSLPPPLPPPLDFPAFFQYLLLPATFFFSLGVAPGTCILCRRELFFFDRILFPFSWFLLCLSLCVIFSPNPLSASLLLSSRPEPTKNQWFSDPLFSTSFLMSPTFFLEPSFFGILPLFWERTYPESDMR